MGIPSRPVPLDEAVRCIVKGVDVTWTTCTSFTYAMHIHKATLGRKRPSGCAVRIGTGDTKGGTTIPQNEAVARSVYGVASEVRVGSNVCTPTYAAGKLRQGRGIGLQGNGGVTVGTPFRSVKGLVNHDVWLNEGRGWHDDGHGNLIPTDVLVYDPAANGRRAAWGTADQSPSWWPWSLVLKYAAGLHPWGEQDPRTLGPGKFYCNIGPDTEPHAHLRAASSGITAAVKTDPFPRTLTSRPPSGSHINVRKAPTMSSTDVGDVPRGKTFIAYQQANGQALTAGGVTSRLWYGDHNGTRWVHSSGVK